MRASRVWLFVLPWAVISSKEIPENFFPKPCGPDEICEIYSITRNGRFQSYCTDREACQDYVDAMNAAYMKRVCGKNLDGCPSELL